MISLFFPQHVKNNVSALVSLFVSLQLHFYWTLEFCYVLLFIVSSKTLTHGLSIGGKLWFTFATRVCRSLESLLFLVNMKTSYSWFHLFFNLERYLVTCLIYFMDFVSRQFFLRHVCLIRFSRSIWSSLLGPQICKLPHPLF